MSMELHSKLGSFLRIQTKILQRLQTIRAADGCSHSQKDSVEASVGYNLAKVLTEHIVLIVSGRGLGLALRPGIFAILDLRGSTR